MSFSTSSLFHKIKQSLADKTPLAAIRFGDAESMVMSGDENDNINANYRRQLGYIPELDEVRDLRQNLIIAFQQADVIGIKGDTNGLNYYWSHSHYILEQHVYLGDKILASIDFHEELMPYYPELLNVDTLIYISCRDLTEQFKARGIKNVYGYHISPEMKFTPEYSGERHYPYHFNRVKEWLNTVPVKGNLVLTGTGFVGKIYNIWARNLGGVAVDIGSMFDKWAGKVTRGINRSPVAIDNTYRL